MGERGPGIVRAQLDICLRDPEVQVTPLQMGRSAYFARAGLKSQSALAHQSQFWSLRRRSWPASQSGCVADTHNRKQHGQKCTTKYN